VEKMTLVHIHPGSDALQDVDFLVVDGAVAANRDAEQKIPALADDIGQHLDDGFRALVLVAFVNVAVVMPVAETDTRLPCAGKRRAVRTALDLPDKALLLLIIEDLAEEHALAATA
jgi:hypothetical protein